MVADLHSCTSKALPKCEVRSLIFITKSFISMEDHDNASNTEYRLTLFSDFTRSFKDIKENLCGKLSEILDEDSLSSCDEGELVNAKISSTHMKNRDLKNRDDNAQIECKLKKFESFCAETPGRRRSSHLRKKRNKHSEATKLPTTDVITLSDENDVQSCYSPFQDEEMKPKLFQSDDSFKIDLNLNEPIYTVSEDEEDKFPIKIIWMSNYVLRFEMGKHEKFSTIFQVLADKENVPKEKILLFLRDQIFIDPKDTPKSLNISIVDIIEGGIKETEMMEVKPTEDDKLQFKCVLKDRKKPLLVTIKKSDMLHCLMVKTSGLLQCPLESLKFKFNGETVQANASSEDLDLEGGEVFEVFVR